MAQQRQGSTVGAWDASIPAQPRVQVVATTRAEARPRAEFAGRRGIALTGARATLELLARQGVMDAWAVARFTEHYWTGLALKPTATARTHDSSWSASRGSTYRVGLPVPREEVLAHHLITGPGPVVVSDLATCDVPGVPQLAAAWGLGSFLGIALIGPDGGLLGTLEAVCSVPTQLDVEDWSMVLMAQGRAIESILYAEFVSLGARRRTFHDQAMLTADHTTRLPDRRGWGVLVAGEEELATPLGNPVGLVLVDLGVIRTVRSMRRAVHVVSSVAEGIEVARVGPRQLGLLAGGLDQTAVETMATIAQSRLEGAGFRTATAHTMRAGLEPLTDTWLRAEHALIVARRERSRSRSR